MAGRVRWRSVMPMLLVGFCVLDGVAADAWAKRRQLPARRPEAAARLVLPHPMIYRPDSSLGRQSAGAAPGLPPGLIAVVEGGPVSSDHAVGSEAGHGADRQGSGGKDAAGQGASAALIAPIAGRLNAAPGDRGGLLLPLEAGVGAAAFASGADVFVVFDVARPLDLSAVRSEPIAQGASIQLFRDATLLRLPGRSGDTVSVNRVGGGWLITASAPRSMREAIALSDDGVSLKLAVSAPGLSLVVPDPLSGRRLLIGTVTSGDAAVAEAQHRGMAVIERTILGVVVDPLSDHLDLRPESDAFRLTGMSAETLGVVARSSGSLTVTDEAAGRVLDLRDGSVQALLRRFELAKGSAAAAPARSRFLPRILAAEAALALGDGWQAATIANVALADDEAGSQSVRAQLVGAAAALLKREFRGTEFLDDSHVPDRSELALWRAVKLAMKNPDSAEAARLFADNLPLLASYPAPLRRILVPLAAETLVRAGTDEQAALVDGLAPAAGLAFPEALLAARRGRTQVAVDALTRLAHGRDLLRADEAVEELARIASRTGSLDAQRSADALEAHLLDARIAGHEPVARQLLEDLRERAGQWNKALGLIREASRLYPEDQADALQRAGRALLGVASSPVPAAGAASLDQAALIEANADLVPSGPDGARVSLALADRLAVLDLPERAVPIIQGLLRAQPTGSGKAALGLRAAALALQLNNSPGALATLAESDPGNLSPEQVMARTLLRARALSAEGQLEQALTVLEPLQTVAALDLRSSLLASRGDWNGATDALLSLVRKTESDPANAAPVTQELLLRLASMASRTGDAARMTQVRALAGDRLTDSGKSALFQFLTSDPSGDALDLERVSSAIEASSGTPAARPR